MLAFDVGPERKRGKGKGGICVADVSCIEEVEGSNFIAFKSALFYI